MGFRTNIQEKEEENLSYLRKNAHRLPETKLKREMKGEVTKILGPTAQLESVSAQQSAAAEGGMACLSHQGRPITKSTSWCKGFSDKQRSFSFPHYKGRL